ncbi:bifunctional hydroxymethylpyrimidine kinase/phosphomethylpyrimidine kinase [Halomonas sp. WWR20]
MSRPPVVLVLAGHDPTGGAGLIADSEAIRACGGWAVTVPTALTVQTTRDVISVSPCSAQGILAAAEALFADIDIAAIKVGLLADVEALEAVIAIVQAHPDLPLVVDPVLRAGGGKELSTSALQACFTQRLLPLVDILTPNRLELTRLADMADDDRGRVTDLLGRGCGGLLVTGTDMPPSGADHANVVHSLYTPQATHQWHWPRLPGHYHGSGCTLAAALSARLAVGEPWVNACEQAQRFTWESLNRALRLGRGQALPNRTGWEFAG